MVSGAHQSVPTPNTHELARVVVIVADGCVADPCALLAIALAAPASEFAAPVKPTTVIDATPDIGNVAFTVIGVVAGRAVGAKAYHTSAVPACALACAARVHVNPVPLFLTALTCWRWSAGVAGVVSGPSAEMNATSSVFAATANAGLVMIVFGLAVLRETNVAIVGAVPRETTIATALPPAASVPPVGVWLMTVPAANVVLAALVTVTVKPAPVSDAVAAACVCPTTFGTATGGRPLDTTKFIAVPTSTVSPSAGFWLMTMPAGTVVLDCCVTTPTTIPAPRMRFCAVSLTATSPDGAPTMSGVIVPSEITRSTGAFAVNVVPSRGLTAITVPILNTVLLACVTVPTTSPACRIAVVAAACVSPRTAGTAGCAGGTGIVMSENRSCAMLRSVSVPVG